MHGEISEDEFDLHSIMYLLILHTHDWGIWHLCNLHSIMYLLILINPKEILISNTHLHSIMYLLILIIVLAVLGMAMGFTFHNVSINSQCINSRSVLPFYLHSIMYLLIQYVASALNAMISSFTFHNVSINSTVRVVWCVGR